MGASGGGVAPTEPTGAGPGRSDEPPSPAVSAPAPSNHPTIGQRTHVASHLADASAQGFTGIAVAADNTSVVDTPDRLRAWLRWEQVADRLMTEQPVTGLCAFDGNRLGRDTLASVTRAHEAMRAG